MKLRLSVTTLLLGSLIALPAYAQSDSDKATARALGQQGELALDGGNWKQAEDYFRRADGLFHAPTLTLGLARAQAHEGKFVEAWESYHRIVIENVTSPPAFAKALQSATAELPSVEGQRAKLTISVTGADAPHVTVNDTVVKAEALGVARFVDPGHVVVTAGADGFKTASRTLDLAPGKEDSVSFALEKGAAPIAAPPASTTPAAAASAGGSSGSVFTPLGIGALAVGGAGLILGGVTGVIALGKHSDLKTECPGGSCDTAASQSTLSSYHTMGALSTVGFIVGGVGAGAGVILLVMAPKPEHKTTGATFRPYVGLGTAGAVGTF